MYQLILCSTSKARKELLQRLQVPFSIAGPHIDETSLPNEDPQQLVLRLALAKAKIHKEKYPNSLLIGCDQVGVLAGRILGKPGSHEEAVEMLLAASGQEVMFYTGLCVYNTATQQIQTSVEEYRVNYRLLTKDVIESYLKKEQPYDCAGSIKVEGLGIALMRELHGNDPSTLTGLPLIKLVTMLENEGFNVV